MNFQDMYMYTSIMHRSHTFNMVWAKRTRSLVICRYRSDRFEIVEFLLAFSIGYNVELLKNSSPDSRQTERISCSTAAERAILLVKVLHLLSMQFFSFSTLYHLLKKIFLGAIQHTTYFKSYQLGKHFPTCLKLLWF